MEYKGYKYSTVKESNFRYATRVSKDGKFKCFAIGNTQAQSRSSAKFKIDKLIEEEKVNLQNDKQ